MTCRIQHLGRYLEGQLLNWWKGHSMTFQQNSFRHITLWFEVKLYNYFTGMITILRQHVACNIWVATLKAKVTAWPSGLPADLKSQGNLIIFQGQGIVREFWKLVSEKWKSSKVREKSGKNKDTFFLLLLLAIAVFLH